MTTDTALAADRQLAARMRRAWPAFFARFGRLTPVQRAVAPTILDGEDVLVCSATASGKTEAACAPLVERFIERASPWMILYVSPTRALVNDLHARLERPLNDAGLGIARRTGEHRHGDSRLSHVLLTTPESFDSMLCRGRRENGHILAHVVAVVIDEVHLLYGTPRGEQVRWALTRLRRLRRQAVRSGWAKDAALQVAALSATLPNPEAVRDALVPNGTVISVPGAREIEVEEPRDPLGSGRSEDVVPAYLSSRTNSEKLLVFCNTRKRVDELAYMLKPRLAPHRYQVMAHHASLPQGAREQAELMARTLERIVICATSTLELGIDIGDIDVVVLDAPPPDIPSLLQRIGRGNRRTGTTRVLACWSNDGERLIQQSMLDAAMHGWLGPAEAGPCHAVVRQQLASYIFQAPSGRRSEAMLLGLAADCEASALAKKVAEHMERTGELVRIDDRLKLGASWIELAGNGGIHSMIESPLAATVVDSASGERLAVGVQVRSGGGLRIGGRKYRVSRADARRVEVEPTKGRELAAAWNYASAGARFVGAGQPQAVRRHLGIPEDVWPIVSVGGTHYVFHFGGARRRGVLSLITSHATAGTLSDWLLAHPAPDTEDGRPPRWIMDATVSSLTQRARGAVHKLEGILARPKANAYLPDSVRIDEILAWLRPEEELNAMKAARWRQADERTATLLRPLVPTR